MNVNVGEQSSVLLYQVSTYIQYSTALICSSACVTCGGGGGEERLLTVKGEGREG